MKKTLLLLAIPTLMLTAPVGNISSLIGAFILQFYIFQLK